MKIIQPIGEIKMSNSEICKWISDEAKQRAKERIAEFEAEGYFNGGFKPKKLPARIQKVVKTMAGMGFNAEVTVFSHNSGRGTEFRWRIQDDNKAGHSVSIVMVATAAEVSAEDRKLMETVSRLCSIACHYNWDFFTHELIKLDLSSGLLPAMNEIVNQVVSGKIQVQYRL